MASNPNEANEPQIELTAADEIKGNDYCFLLQEEGKAGFSANDLVWGKIKSHPWWPGQIFDPRYASEMALKCQKKDHFLVAYFGDKTFGWVPESQLKPFQPHFSEMEEQSGGASFASAVGSVLEEVSKRVELGLACHCSADDGGYAKLFERRKVENAGVREGTCSVVDKFTVANAFQPESLLGYVWALAQCPSRGFVRLELMVAAAQLKAFYHFKGRSQLPIFASRDGLVEDEAEILPVKSTRPRGRPRKNRSNEDGSEQEHPSNKTEVEEIADLGRSEKDGVGKEVDLKTGTRSSTRTRTRSVKLADHISENANLLKEESPLILNCIDETPQNSVTKRSRRKGADHLSRAGKENEVAIKEYSSPSEMLSQLYQVASDPMEVYNFLPMIQGFFIDFWVSYFSNSSDNQEPIKSTGRKRGRKKKLAESDPASLEMSDPDFRFSPSSNSSEDQEPVKSAGRKRGRKKKVVNCEPDSIDTSDPDFRLSPSSDSSEDQETIKSVGRKSSRKKKVVNSEPDYIQDSYWSDIILQSSPEREPALKGQKRKGGSKKKGRTKKTKAVGESVLHDPKALSMDTEQDNLLVGFSNPHEKQEEKEDSYWSNVMLQSSPEREPASKGQKWKGGSQKGQTKKTKPAGESVPYDPKTPTIDIEQNNLLVGFSNPHGKQEVKEKRIVGETPTALILSFSEYDFVPPAAELIKIFSSYGSLKEEETEVLRKTNRAKVVFKYRHDAENAFSSAGQSDVFGPAIVSYRLRYLPSPKSSPASSPLDMNYALPTKDGGLERQGQEDIGVAIDNM